MDAADAAMLDVADDDAASTVSSEAAVRMMEHNQRFQDAVLATMERQVVKAEAETARKSHALKAAEEARGKLALSLAHASAGMKQLRVALDQKTNELTSTKDELATTKRLNSKAAKDSQATKKRLQEAEDRAEQLRKELDAKTLELQQNKQIRDVYDNDLKSQHTVEAHLRVHVQSLQDDVKQLQQQNRDMLMRLNESQGRERQLQEEVQAQVAETKTAQTAFNKLAEEMKALEVSRDLLLKQWERSVAAMMQRDQVILNVSTQASKAKSELIATKNSERTLEQENTVLQRSAETAKRLAEDTSLLKGKLKVEATRLAKEKESLTKQVKSLRAAVKSLNSELAASRKERERLVDLNARTVRKLSHAKSDVSALKIQHQTATQAVTTAEKEKATKLNAISQQFSDQMSDITKRLVQAEHSLARTVNEKLAVQHELDELHRQFEQERLEHGNLLKKFEELHRTGHQAEVELERRREEVGRLRSQLSHKEEHDNTHYVAEIQRLRHQLEIKEAERKQIERAYTEAQAQIIRLNRTNATSRTVASTARSEAKKLNVLSEHFQSKASKSARATASSYRNADLLRLKARKQEHRAQRLSVKNAKLQAELSNSVQRAKQAQLKMEERLSVAQTRSRSTIQRNTMASRELDSIRRQWIAAQSKVDVLTEQVHSYKKTNATLTQKVFSLQAQLKGRERDLHASARQFEEWKHQLSSTLSSPGTPRTARSRMASPRLSRTMTAMSQDTYEMKKKLNHMTTVAAERQHQVLLLKQRLKDMSVSNDKEEQLAIAQKVHHMQTQHAGTARQLAQAHQQLLRAKAVACSLERQLRRRIISSGGAADSIDYSVDIGAVADMSMQLKRVIDLRLTTPPGGARGSYKRKSGNGGMSLGRDRNGTLRSVPPNSNAQAAQSRGGASGSGVAGGGKPARKPL